MKGKKEDEGKRQKWLDKFKQSKWARPLPEGREILCLHSSATCCIRGTIWFLVEPCLEWITFSKGSYFIWLCIIIIAALFNSPLSTILLFQSAPLATIPEWEAPCFDHDKKFENCNGRFSDTTVTAQWSLQPQQMHQHPEFISVVGTGTIDGEGGGDLSHTMLIFLVISGPKSVAARKRIRFGFDHLFVGIKCSATEKEQKTKMH